MHKYDTFSYKHFLVLKVLVNDQNNSDMLGINVNSQTPCEIKGFDLH